MLPLSLYILMGYAFVLSTLTTWAVSKFAWKVGFVSRPNPIVRQHTRTVAYLGGVGIALGAAVSLALIKFVEGGRYLPGNFSFPVPLSVGIGSVIFLILGVVDDLRVLKPALKFVLQALGAAVAVRLGLCSPVTGWVFWDAALSWLWILTLVNAFNLTDVCDGLVGGLSVVMLLFLAHFRLTFSGTALLLAGACLGFLVFNLPPARIFLGDAGSHFLGFLLAAYTLIGATEYPMWSHRAVMVLTIGVPLFELVFLTAIRRKKGLPWWKGSPDHFALRLQAAGCTRWQTDLIAWGMAALLCTAGILLLRVPPPIQIVLLLSILALLGLCWRLLLNWEAEKADTV